MASRFAKLLLIATTVVKLVTASSALEHVAKQCKVSVQGLEQLLNTTDYSNIDIAEYYPLLNQPSEAISSWTADAREHVLEVMKQELSNGLSGISPEPTIRNRKINPQHANVKRQVNEQALYRARERQLLSIHNARIQSARNNCFDHWECGVCVVAAGLTGAAGISSCIEAAIGAELLTAEATFGLSTAPIWAALTTCVLRSTAATTTAIGVCHALL